MQVRYFAHGPKAEAELWYQALETAFEDEGAPLGLTEIDEARQIYEACAYLDVADGGADRAGEFAEVTGVPLGEVGCEMLPDKDWMAEVLAGLKPVRAGRFLVHGGHDRGKVDADDISIEIEAGMAFGTGHHGTTAGCLMMIEEELLRRTPRATLDLGTGSAVLAIGAAKFGAIDVLATDIDPVAVAVARENASANGVSDRVEVIEVTGFDSPTIAERGPFDLIIANVLAGPLKEMAPDFAAHLSESGRVILSGILVDQGAGVLDAFDAEGLRHVKTLTMGEWVTLLLER
ncbi:50S ribosomal protein L11 methyltransferase [Fulvimarina sp. 2208YS6-2-32]|uniref:Ribosomal protein L11 methyltransferase n=1 Tax=Fulvimarina uroteuthidis TaxID=3098149 RepID=A0ABU5HYK5_9HYPH|nr:50S ribosomal protein L11 methyltransferase [Fulvimarina sp. 2208YS6-2-32]MDY8108199.1 50S ribosomal protein L11 methyltransferase [Fulvimarina sp. 2208YS6-2-32]